MAGKVSSGGIRPLKVIIAGGRDFTDYELLEEKCDYYFSTAMKRGVPIEVVSGTARGADMLGERYAYSHDLTIKQFPADWDTHGKKAGYLRNEEMAKYADALIAFWDGKSKGTNHMINLANKHNLHVRVIKYEGL